MTVTIKKNVDVQATLEATQLKYQVKRDLSGDVQWTNMTSVGIPIAVTSLGGATTQTRTDDNATAQGWNFAKLPKFKVKAKIWIYGATGSGGSLIVTGWERLNGVNKTTAQTVASCTIPTTTISCSSTNSDFCIGLCHSQTYSKLPKK